MISKLTKIKSDDRVLNQFQDEVTSTVNDIIDSQIIDSVLLKSVSLALGDNIVNHKLGRELVGWFITRQRKTTTTYIYDTQDTNTIKDKTLNLNASQACVVDIYVF